MTIFAAALLLILSACQPAATPTSAPPPTAAPSSAPTQVQASPTAAPTTAPSPVPPTAAPTAAPTAPPTQPSVTSTGEITFDYSALAQDLTVETVPAQDASSGSPYWDILPQYQRVTLKGYPVTNHLLKPQIFIYPFSGLASANEGAGKIASDLQALLQSQQAGDHLPFMPLFNASQVIHAQVQYLDFKNGKGVRFLTQFDQAFLPINNYELIYTFQGLTSDGKYYIAAVLPVTNPELPASAQVDEQMIKEFSDFPGYISKMVTLLDGQPAGSFTPDLSKLDAMIQSIEVK